MSWAVTVAAIIRQGDRYLVVEETDGVHPDRVFNQPAGHVDPGESILDAVVRETWEETGAHFTPEYLIGIYPIQASNGRDYLRFAFAGAIEPSPHLRPQPGETLAVHWLTRTEIAIRPRSSAVLACLDDFEAGVRHPLSLVSPPLRDR